jgi:hypothetical protein
MHTLHLTNSKQTPYKLKFEPRNVGRGRCGRKREGGRGRQSCAGAVANSANELSGAVANGANGFAGAVDNGRDLVFGRGRQCLINT